jgi:hypothetical protein
MTSLVNYGLPWIKGSHFLLQVNDIINITAANLGVLLNQNFGGIICYQDP